MSIATILIATSATWKVLQQRRRGNAGMNNEGEQQDPADNLVPSQQSATSELLSGLDGAELVTQHWESVELPPRGAFAKLGGPIRDYDLAKRVQ